MSIDRPLPSRAVPCPALESETDDLWAPVKGDDGSTFSICKVQQPKVQMLDSLAGEAGRCKGEQSRAELHGVNAMSNLRRAGSHSAVLFAETVLGAA